LRGDDSAQGVAAGQDDAAVIDFGCRPRGGFRYRGSLDEFTAAGRAPVGFDSMRHYGVALCADSLHKKRVADLSLMGQP